jgi:hypothetical protein
VVRRRKTNRWWNDELRDIYEKKKSAYQEYKNSGYDEKQKERFLEYKKLFKLQKRYNIDLKRNQNLQLINNMFKMNKTNFWRQVKKLNKNNTQIDAKIEDINNDYNKLFNIKNDSAKSMANECKEKIESIIKDFSSNESNECPINDIEMKMIIKNKIKCLSNNKSIGISGLSNEMIKNGIVDNSNTQEDQQNDPMIDSISTLFKSMITNQYVPHFFNYSIIKPLVKDINKDTDNINNLRGIAISDTLQNLYESVLEEVIKNEITTDSKQMGFKSNNSCAHAIMVLKQTMNVARKFGHRLYIAAIDAAKAFDKVNREILWIKMIEIGVSPIIVLAVLNYYAKSMMLVNLEDTLSKPFKTTLGVRQGGVLSPLLFSIYINDILVELQKLEIGYKVGDLIIDVLAYADDLLLITKSKLDLHVMLNKLTDLGEKMEIKFNASKSMYMVFNKYNQRTKMEELYDEWDGNLLLGGNPIERVESFRYLGAMIHDSGRCLDHMDKRRKSALASVAKLITMGLCSESMHPVLKAEMFKVYIRPIIMYAMENFNLNGGEIRKLKSAEGNALKRIIGISTRCKSTDLFLSFDMMPTKERIDLLKLNHFIRMGKNGFTKQFLSELRTLNVDNSLIKEIEELTKDIPDIAELSLYDKCDIRIHEIEDEHNYAKATSKTAQLLKIIYDLSDANEMKKVIFNLVKFD